MFYYKPRQGTNEPGLVYGLNRTIVHIVYSTYSNGICFGKDCFTGLEYVQFLGVSVIRKYFFTNLKKIGFFHLH